jgi:hypothetical protein
MSFNFGKDATLDLSVADPTTGLEVPITSLGKLKSFGFEMIHETTKVEGVDENGKVDARDHFGGWNLQMTVARRNGMADKLAQIYQDNYLSGGGQIYATVTMTAKNQGLGGTDQYSYPRTILNFGDLGKWEAGGKEVDLTLKGYCPERKERKNGVAVLG